MDPQESQDDEARRLFGVEGHVALGVPAPLVAGAGVADRVGGVAQIHRLGAEQGTRGRQRCAAAVGHIAEGHYRHDGVGVLSGQRRAPQEAADRIPGDDVHHRRALRVSAEHQRRIRAFVGHGLDVRHCVFGAVVGVQLGEAGLVVDRIRADVHAGLLAQRAHEGLADTSDAGRFVGAASEDHLGIRAVVCAGRGDAGRDSGRRDQHDTGGKHRGGVSAGASHTAVAHRRYLTEKPQAGPQMRVARPLAAKGSPRTPSVQEVVE